MPKQFLSVTENGKTMIQLTVERHLPIVSYEDIYIVTNKEYVSLVQEQLPQIPKENILAEPISCNTAPCIGFAASVISKKYDEAVMMVLASDHLIKNETLYLDTMLQAIDVASEEQNIITIGIMPSYPEIGYGYINFGRDQTSHKKQGVYVVNRFVEKPNLDTAKEYISSGDYLWNSGMFVWKVSTIFENYRNFLPDIYEGLIKIKDSYDTEKYESVLNECFSNFKSESVDYGIMEKAPHIYTVPGNFGWDDVGNWLALERINKRNEYGNIVRGDVITINTHNSIIYGNNKLIATVGIEGIIIIDTMDALLVCSKTDTADVKKVLENLKICNRTELL